MQWQSTPYVLLLFGAAVTTLAWALYGIRTARNEGRKRYVVAFVVLCLAVAFWCAAYAIQLASATLGAKLLAYKVLHVGGVAAPPAWLAFALAYSGREEWLTPATVAGLVAIPLALLLALPTNPFSLALTGAHLETHGTLTVLVTENGPLYLLHLAYSYVAVVAGAWLIVTRAFRSATPVRRQSVLLAAGAVVPLVLNVFNVLSAPPFGDVGVNLTPVSLSLSTALFGVAIFRYQVLDVRPIAWEVVLSQMTDGVVVLDDRERIVDQNPAAEALLGTDDALIGTDAPSNLPHYDLLERENPLLVTQAGASDEEPAIRLIRSPLTKHREMYGWVVLAQDVTGLERQRRELERQNARLDEFASVVSHDLRSPLTLIGGYAELAEETGADEHFETIHRTISRMETLLEELLRLAREGKTVTEFRPVPLTNLAESVRRGIGDVRLRVDVRTDAMVMADENRLRQVLDNLFRNARDNADGDVTVRIGEIPGGFYVEDDGPGIPGDTRAKVFDVGFSTRSGGTGFGLAIVRDIAEAHGWSISVTEGETGGARFEVTDVDVAPSG